MSLGSALSIAQSGLTASTRAADLTARNVANALTEGYSRKELSLATRLTGGVTVTGITRYVDQALIADRRLAGAGSAGSLAIADFHAGLEKTIGTPDKAGSLDALLSRLDAALIGAASQPQSQTALTAAVGAAETLARQVNTLSEGVQADRLAADGKLAASVTRINAALTQVETLNTQIAGAGPGRDVTALQDQRQQLVDGISGQIPLREIQREDGRIALMTTGGATLLDGKAAVLGFEAVTTVTADMTMASGALSGLTLNGADMSAASLGNGDLGAQFAIRDVLAPDAQARIDAVSEDLTARFEGTGLLERGAGGMKVNAVLSGEPWRLRDGLDAAGEGAAGDATRLNTLVSAMSGGRGAHAVAGDLLSATSSARLAAEDQAGFDAARFDTLRTAELAGGVDTDAEMAKLLSIEQAYAANAKIIRAVDDMMKTILGL